MLLSQLRHTAVRNWYLYWKDRVLYPKSSFTKATRQTRLKQELPPPPSLFGSRSEPIRRAETIHVRGCHQHPCPTTPLHLWVGSLRRPLRLGRGHQNPPLHTRRTGDTHPSLDPRYAVRAFVIAGWAHREGRTSPSNVIRNRIGGGITLVN